MKSELVSWKDSFEKINTELDMANKKKQALDDLYNTGSISEGTYENLGKELEKEIQEIETRQKVLAERMTCKLNELEQQVQALETFLANSRMSYVTGEISEDMHNQKSNALNFGLEATKQELNFIREVITQLIPEETPLSPTPETTEVLETPEETPIETTVEDQPEVVQTPEETPTEPAMEGEAEVVETPEETPIDTAVEEETEVVDTAEETPIETAIEGETEVVQTPEETPIETAAEEETEVAPSVPVEEPVEVTPVPEETEIETPMPMDVEEATETTQEEGPTEEVPAPFWEESKETETPTEEETLED